MTCSRCGTKTDSWPCPNCGFPVMRMFLSLIPILTSSDLESVKEELRARL